MASQPPLAWPDHAPSRERAGAARRPPSARGIGVLRSAQDQRISGGGGRGHGTGSGATRIRLLAGGEGGGASVSFLKFKVTSLRGGRTPARAEVRLTRRSGDLPPYVELSRVPGTNWRADDLKVDNAPRLGSVVASARPGRGDRSVSFDVTGLIDRRARTRSRSRAAAGGRRLLLHAGYAATGPGRPALGFLADALRPSYRTAALPDSTAHAGGRCRPPRGAAVCATPQDCRTCPT